jgi:hypothetical protein
MDKPHVPNQDAGISVCCPLLGEPTAVSPRKIFLSFMITENFNQAHLFEKPEKVPSMYRQLFIFLRKTKGYILKNYKERYLMMKIKKNIFIYFLILIVPLFFVYKTCHSEEGYPFPKLKSTSLQGEMKTHDVWAVAAIFKTQTTFDTKPETESDREATLELTGEKIPEWEKNFVFFFLCWQGDVQRSMVCRCKQPWRRRVNLSQKETMQQLQGSLKTLQAQREQGCHGES